VELDSVSVRELLGEAIYNKCRADFGEDAAIQFEDVIPQFAGISAIFYVGGGSAVIGDNFGIPTNPYLPERTPP